MLPIVIGDLVATRGPRFFCIRSVIFRRVPYQQYRYENCAGGFCPMSIAAKTTTSAGSALTAGLICRFPNLVVYHEW